MQAGREKSAGQRISPEVFVFALQAYRGLTPVEKKNVNGRAGRDAAPKAKGRLHLICPFSKRIQGETIKFRRESNSQRNREIE
jgi:hypothetical protein